MGKRKRTVLGPLILGMVLLTGPAADAQDKDPLEKKCLYGITLARSGNGDKATTVFASILSTDPEDPRAHTNLGNLSLLNGEFENALSFYHQALTADSTDPGILLNVAITQMLSGNDDGARETAALSIKMAGGLKEAAALVGIQLDEEETAKASKKVYLDAEEIKNLLRSALVVNPASAATSPDSVGGTTDSKEIPETGLKKRAQIWRSGAPRASGDTQAAGLLYWKD